MYIFPVDISKIIVALNECFVKTHIKLHKGMLVEDSYRGLSKVPSLILRSADMAGSVRLSHSPTSSNGLGSQVGEENLNGHVWYSVTV